MIPAGQLVDRATGQVIVERLFIADRFLTRLRGLQFRQPLPAGDGLLLHPCGSIHTCCVWFDLDLICLDGDGTVVELHSNVRPWRIVLPTRKTVSIVEVTAGNTRGVVVGCQLALLH